MDKFFEFGDPESLNNWVTTCDSDWDHGYSTANVTLSPSGSGIFSGNISTKTPKTGKIQAAGYANLRFVPPTVRKEHFYLFKKLILTLFNFYLCFQRSFYRDNLYMFAAYTHLAFRVRGDGRNYFVNLHPNNMFDVTFMDVHSYILHTRGGPYWQETVASFKCHF